MKIMELVADVVFNADQKKLSSFVKEVGDLNMKSILSAASLGSVYEVARKSLEMFDSVALGVNKFGWETGQSTEKVQKWSKFAEQMGVSAGVVQQSISTLEDQISQMNISGASPVWGYLGIDPRGKKDYFEVLSMIRERFKGMSDESQRYFLHQLGLSVELKDLFRATDAEWVNINNQLALSQEQLKRGDELHRNWVRAAQELGQAWQEVGAEIAPIAIMIAKSITTIVEASKGLFAGIGAISGIVNPKNWGGQTSWVPEGVHMGLPPGVAMSGAPVNNNWTFNITGDDPRKIGEHVRREIQKANSDAMYQLAR
jgi:hypothetical protein